MLLAILVVSWALNPIKHLNNNVYMFYMFSSDMCSFKLNFAFFSLSLLRDIEELRVEYI